MKRLLIVGCSETKRDDIRKLPAIDRYDGPAFRVIRKAMRAGFLADTHVFILSSEHGLIAEDRYIADYDRRMTVARAAELMGPVTQELFGWFLRNTGCTSVFVNVGRAYRPALGGFVEWCARRGLACTEAKGAIGERCGQMKTWLELTAAGG